MNTVPAAPSSAGGSRLRVGLVAHNVHDSGGMERSLAELIRHASDRIDFHVVSRSLASDLRAAVRWTRVPVPGRPVPLFFGSYWAAAAPAVSRLDVDLVHSMGAIVPNAVDLASVQFCHAAFRGLPAAAKAVGGGRLRQLNRGIDLRLALTAERRAYRPGRVRHLAAASSGVQDELARSYPAIRSSVVPNGITPELFSGPAAPDRADARREFGYEDGDVVAVFVGGDWQRKGLSHAVEGLARAVADGASGLRLSVVGGGDPEPHLAHARSLGVEARLRFFGRTTEVHRHLRAADAFVFPTAYEAFPLVALEAAAAGLPIVATPVNGIRDLVQDGREGIIVDRSGASIGAALTRLCADPELRRRMGRAAATAGSAYTWRSAADATVEIYQDLARAPQCGIPAAHPAR